MLNIWIDPLPAHYFAKRLNLNHNKNSKGEESNRIESKVALIGHGNFMNAIREAFYALDLSKVMDDTNDLGDIRNNDISLMTAAYKELISQDIFPIVIDSSPNTSLSIANALEQLNYDTSFGAISPSTKQNSDFYSVYSELIDGGKANKISILAYQKHFANPLDQVMPKLDPSGLLSLGKIRDDIRESEPILRSLDFLSIDIKSIKASDSQGLKNQKNIGLNSEEACKLLHYASSSTKLKGLHISGFEFDEETNTNAGVELIACLIWYTLKGRQNAYFTNQSKQEMTNFIVELDSWDQQLNFWKNEKSEHWWIEIPSLKNENEGLVPCSESEYTLAKENKMSNRLFHILSSY